MSGAALPLVRAWSGYDFEGAKFPIKTEAGAPDPLNKVFADDFNNIFETGERIYFEWSLDIVNEKEIENLNLKGTLENESFKSYLLGKSSKIWSIPYDIEDMEKILNYYQTKNNSDFITFTAKPFDVKDYSKNQQILTKLIILKEKKLAGLQKKFDTKELLGKKADAAGKEVTVESEYVAYFKFMPTFGRTDEILKGKLVSELAASQILDDAALSSIDLKDAAYRLYAYAKRAADGAPAPTELEGVLENLVKTIGDQTQTAEEPNTPLPVINAVRRALIDKKMIPVRNMLFAKEDKEAGGKPTDIDAPTQEFERDSAADMCTVEMVQKTVREMVYTTIGALLSTASDKARIIGNVSSFGDDAATRGLISLGAIVYAGKIENFVSSGDLEESRKPKPDKDAISAVKAILQNNSIPLNYTRVVSEVDITYSKSIKTYIEFIDATSISVLARVEQAREIDLSYEPIVVFYGTDSESNFFGTGSNVTMITDCAFIAARILNSLMAKNKFSQNPEAPSPKVESGTSISSKSNDYWSSKFVLNGDNPVETILSELDEQVEASYTGHCTVRTADMGRILGASLVNQPLRKKIQKLAWEKNYRSLKYFEHPLNTEIVVKDTDKAKTKFFHQIWQHELGNHAVAQGGARLNESHMMIPFLVRATTDSEHVVPTLCAFDDWIGPTDMFERIEQMAMMEIENFAHSRPTVKYARGGIGRMINDVGTMIKTAPDTKPFGLLTIIESVAEGHRNQAATCCALLMTAIHNNSTFSSEVRKGGLARQVASETKVRELAARIGNLKIA